MDATWRALADPTRRRLIELLRDGPRTTGDLCRAFSTSRFAVMKHLRVLEQGGLLTVRREGRQRWNSLNPKSLKEIAGRWTADGGTQDGVTTRAVETRDVTADGPAEATSPGPRAAEVFIDARPWQVFDALTVNVAAWWGAPHLRSADASNLVLEPQPGGRFYEEWGHRQGALRGIVTAIRQDERLELTGPLFSELGETWLSFQLEPREGGTLLLVSWNRLPPAVVQDLVRVRLREFVERGVRSGIAS